MQIFISVGALSPSALVAVNCECPVYVEFYKHTTFIWQIKLKGGKARPEEGVLVGLPCYCVHN